MLRPRPTPWDAYKRTLSLSKQKARERKRGVDLFSEEAVATPPTS